METQSTSTALAHDLSKLYGLRVSVQHAPRIRGFRFYPTASVLTESLGTPGRRQTTIILDPRTRMHACTHACTFISDRALAREQLKLFSPRVLLKRTTRSGVSGVYPTARGNAKKKRPNTLIRDQRTTCESHRVTTRTTYKTLRVRSKYGGITTTTTPL